MFIKEAKQHSHSRLLFPFAVEKDSEIPANCSHQFPSQSFPRPCPNSDKALNERKTLAELKLLPLATAFDFTFNLSLTQLNFSVFIHNNELKWQPL